LKFSCIRIADCFVDRKQLGIAEHFAELAAIAVVLAEAVAAAQRLLEFQLEPELVERTAEPVVTVVVLAAIAADLHLLEPVVPLAVLVEPAEPLVAVAVVAADFVEPC
jgi:hypothetical protein